MPTRGWRHPNVSPRSPLPTLDDSENTRRAALLPAVTSAIGDKFKPKGLQAPSSLPILAPMTDQLDGDQARQEGSLRGKKALSRQMRRRSSVPDMQRPGISAMPRAWSSPKSNVATKTVEEAAASSGAAHLSPHRLHGRAEGPPNFEALLHNFLYPSDGGVKVNTPAAQAAARARWDALRTSVRESKRWTKVTPAERATQHKSASTAEAEEDADALRQRKQLMDDRQVCPGCGATGNGDEVRARAWTACVCQYVSMFFASSQILTHNCPLTGSTLPFSHAQQWRRWRTGVGPLPVCHEQEHSFRVTVTDIKVLHRLSTGLA